MSKPSRFIIFASLFIGLLAVILINNVYGSEINTSNYELQFVFSGGTDLFGGNIEKRISAVNLYVDDIKLEGARSTSASCYAGSEITSSCIILQILQNELLINQNDKLIQQNDKIISLLQDIADDGDVVNYFD